MWDVVSVVAKRLGYRVIAERIPRKRVDQMLLEGYIDGTPRAREWADNPEQFLFTDPVVDIEEVFFAPAQSDFSYESPDDLVSKPLLLTSGTGIRCSSLTSKRAEFAVSMFPGTRTCSRSCCTATDSTRLSLIGWSENGSCGTRASGSTST
ncbi:type 2 periplasmic-binding domain-containing protein [Marinobacter salsuginis]|uniref:hypothetical protein n=1 Tax=Marinobacter salsuginis TaxID=418719 RepID=UPI00224BA800